MPKKTEILTCEICDFKCFKKSNYTKHINTSKHKNRTFLNNLEQKNAASFICKCCYKSYAARNSLWYHEKKCTNTKKCQKDPDADDDDDFFINEKELIMTLLNQNNQLQTQIIELCKDKSITNINSGNNINSHNKTFNLNVFLNEYCKDAMNITEFVDSLKLQLSDLENVGKLGFVEGISNIIVKNLKAMDVSKRPVHCSDSKREVMYIKDEDKWEKENEEKLKLRAAIKKIAKKNSRLLPQFKEKYPDCVKSNSPHSDKFNKLIIEAMGGSGDNDLEKENKIIKKIAKNVIIDKNIEIN
jgi:hypothetical protein